MGMAASQARYLGLTARKTNCEWEGQQINQARTALANQSANLFNQMLALSVPDCPDKTDFTTLQYSYSDGNNESVLDNWRQLSDSNNQYNYVVDHWYYADIYTGSKKLMSDPQATIKNDSNEVALNTTAGGTVFNEDDLSYTYTGVDAEGNPVTHVYQDLTDYKFDAELQNAILDLAHEGYIQTNEFGEVDVQTLNSLRGYHDGTSWHFATVSDLENASNKEVGLENGTWTLNKDAGYRHLLFKAFKTPLPTLLEFRKLVSEYKNTVTKIRQECLVLQGDADEVVPYTVMQYVKENIGSKNAYFTTVKKGRHVLVRGSCKDKVIPYIHSYLRGGRKWKQMRKSEI